MRVLTHPAYNWLAGDFEITVKVSGFVFRFVDLAHLRDMLARFKSEHTGSDGKSSEFGKLPMWLKDKKTRPLVVKALEAVLANPPRPKWSRPDFKSFGKYGRRAVKPA